MRSYSRRISSYAARRPSLPDLIRGTTGDANKAVAELSMGQQRRLDLALALAARPHILLLDEPTNHLSIALVDELTEALHTTGAAIVLATHDRQMQRDIHTWAQLSLTLPIEAVRV
ncbi:ATP-binding cassette domain-containing protein [Streptomyces phaeochromogenes]|uniref:ATP-binding cassette domain-containing protein n=1 Tax=Streptomyces phaeochromogenes TaxID=1923 RepID=UPI00371D7A48